MKLIFVNRYFYPDQSATSQLLSDLAVYLAERGHRVDIVCSRQIYTDPQAALDRTEIYRGIRIHRVWTSRFGRDHLAGRALDYLTFYMTALLCLLRVIERGDIVVAKTDPPLISVLAALAVRIKGGVLVNWLQDLFPEVAERLGVKGIDRLSPILRRLRNYSLNRARWNVVIGEQMAECLRSEVSKPDTVRVIPNWALTEVGPDDVALARTLREQWGLGNRFVVGYSGNMGRGHEFETIMSAAVALKDNRDIVFLFVGDGAQRPWLEQTVANEGLENVLFKPYQPIERLSASLCVPDVHLISLLPEMEGLIVPSKFYGVVAAGRPVIFIGDTVGELGQEIQRAAIGRSFNIGDKASLVEHILQLSAEKSIRDQQCACSRELHRSTYSRENRLKSWRDLLDGAKLR